MALLLGHDEVRQVVSGTQVATILLVCVCGSPFAFSVPSELDKGCMYLHCAAAKIRDSSAFESGDTASLTSGDVMASNTPVVKSAAQSQRRWQMQEAWHFRQQKGSFNFLKAIP